MSCLTPESLITSWSGLLTEQEMREQVGHLAGCPRCRHMEKNLRTILSLLPHAWKGQPLGSTEACVSETELVEYLGDRADRDENSRLESHVSGCRHCLGQLAEILVAWGQPLPAIEDEWQAVTAKALLIPDRVGAEEGRPVEWLPRLRWAVSVAAVLVLAVLWHQHTPGPPVERTEEAAPAQVRQAPAVQPALPGLLWPQEGQRISRGDLDLRWQAMAGARHYEVTLLNHRGDVLWEATAQGTSMRVATDLTLVAGERYFVWVTARLENGRTVRSPSVAFELVAGESR